MSAPGDQRRNRAAGLESAMERKADRDGSVDGPTFRILAISQPTGELTASDSLKASVCDADRALHAQMCRTFVSPREPAVRTDRGGEAMP